MTVSKFASLTTVAVAAAAVVLPFAPAGAVGGKTDSTDWPCPQRKVTTLGPTELQWQGAAPETVKGWRADSDVAAVVRVLSSRRTPQDEAVKALKAYAEKVPATERGTKLTLVFAGLLETVNEYRISIINGIERFNKRQKSRSSEIEEEGATLAALQKDRKSVV